SGGWFGYYVIRMPAAHGFLRGLARDVLFDDLPRGFVLTLATAAALVRLARRPRDAAWWPWLVLAGFVAGAGSRLHIGGWLNVLQPWASFTSAAGTSARCAIFRLPRWPTWRAWTARCPRSCWPPFGRDGSPPSSMTCGRPASRCPRSGQR